MTEQRTRAWTVALTAIGSVMAALDTLVVASALNTIRLDLGAGIEQLEWTVNAYNLSFAVLLITAAALGDRLGRRRVYAAGLSLFALASAACALAPNAGLLIAARTVQGAGAALMLPLALALLSAAFPPDKRGVAIGMFSAITGIAVALGPLVGGVVVEGIAWEWIFWINVPIGLLAAPQVLRKVRESHGPDVGLDLPGLGLISAGAFGVVWALVRANDAGWGSAEVLAGLLGGLALIGAFAVWQRRASEPMLPPHLFRSRAFSAGNGAIFFTIAPLFACVFLFAQYLQATLGYGPLETGLRLMPWTVTFILVAPAAGALADRVGERPLMATGLAVNAAGLGWLALIADAGTSYAELLGPFVIAGIGVSMAIPSGQNAVVRGLPLAEVGKAAGVNSMMRELGGVFGIAVAVAVFAGAGSYASGAAFSDGFAPAVAVAAGMALIGALIAFALPPGKPVGAPVGDEVPAEAGA